ncbi:short-chain dehydrogenase TIC 32, chloroplastic-like [Gossypium australe]|uniref:Short-chain dehydrogenase TIC 32, chloroplastic-like n=1 Tax=Gossypium australe TaxID=47621 RepID=A0A5B6W3H4_9ROSI|nr:short-chain dehydrogenase TIC 32, chloroplastic-like [Gossypium australe]
MLETVKYLIGSRGASGFGSKSTAEEVTETCPDLRSITAIITEVESGATSGIGAETARVLAKRGARLVIPARNLKAAAEAKARIVSEFPNSEIVIMALDLSSLSSVRKFVLDFESLDLPLNLLINNAGRFAHHHAISEDGIEMTFATNYLGKFAMSLFIDKTVTKQDDGDGKTKQRSRENRERVVKYQRLVFRRYDPIPSQYDATRAYALSKLANVLHTKELAQRLKEMGANVTVNCVHPGIVRTRLTREREGFITDLVFFLASKLLKTIPQAASTTCYVATHPRLENVSGKYFADCNETWTSKLGSDSIEASKLWTASEIMVSEIKKGLETYTNRPTERK